MILNYPVISFADSLTHQGSRYNLIGPALPPEEFEQIMADWNNSAVAFQKIPVPAEDRQAYSNEMQVRADTPPTFITSAVDDDVVKVQNTLVFIAALQQNHVPVGSFFYATGGHGYGLDNPTSAVDWMAACLVWLRAQGLSTACFYRTSRRRADGSRQDDKRSVHLNCGRLFKMLGFL